MSNGVVAILPETRTVMFNYQTTVYAYDAVNYRHVEVLDYVTSKEYSSKGDSPNIDKREIPAIEAHSTHPRPPPAGKRKHRG